MHNRDYFNHRRPVHEGLLVLDYGAQYTLLIARRFRELGIYAEVIDGMAKKPPDDFKVRGVILSGGPDSVYQIGARRAPDWVFDLGCPVLGICYGMQCLVERFGGALRGGVGREYGRSIMTLVPELGAPAAATFWGLATEQTVWMNHGDDVAQLPEAFVVAGTTEDGVIAAIVHRTLPLVGVQFHPEVEHTQAGRDMLARFAKDVCRVKPNWQTGDMLTASIENIRQVVGAGRVLIACSGGVDSTVAAALLSRALGPERVTAVFCDTGLMRQDEVPWVAQALRQLGLKHVEVIHAEERFLAALAGITDPEEKRKRIGRQFITEFEAYAKTHPDAFTHLGQGTLYPDVIESAAHGAGAKVIKSHHNVGGLPETLHLPLVEPLRFLFKDEARTLGEALGLPKEMVWRHPFPGPGLAVRILGAVTSERLQLLRQADAVFISALRERKLYHQVWQAFVVLLPVQSVGVMGDNRTYQMTAALRAVNSSDGMTADVSPLPMDFLTEVAALIVKKVHGINRVVYDVTTKPPATIEWE